MKPTQAPTRAAITTATWNCPPMMAMTSTVVAEMAETPLARPSRPSIRFTELVMATIHSTVRGMDRLPSTQ